MHVDPERNTETDDTLLRLIAGGDEAAFRTLYRRYTPRMRALAFRILGGHVADAEDALQESWIRAVSNVGQFSRGSSLGTWLCGICINAAWEMLRRRKRGVVVELVDEPPAAHSEAAERIDIESAVQRLPDTQRVVLVLHDIEGYTHDEIARQLGFPKGTSKSHLFRARRSLRVMLQSYERVPE
jgi:RNA polymerase sigma factor (sigma-70 family)